MLKKTTCKLVSFVLISASVMAVSCIDNNYDLNKEIDMTVSVGGAGLTIPIGYTDSVKLNSIIDTASSGALILGDDDIYAISKSDDIETVDIEVARPTISDIAPEFEGVTVAFEKPTRTGSLDQCLVAYINDASDFEIDEEVDAALKSLKQVYWNEPVTMTYMMQFDRFPGEAIRNGILLDNVEIQLPEFILFAPEEGIENGLLKLSGRYDPNTNRPYTRELKVIGMDFTRLPGLTESGLVVENQRLFIDRSQTGITVGGFITTDPEEEINPDALHEFRITPSVIVPNMEVSQVIGQFDPKIDDIDELVELELGDDLDFLKDDEVYLDIDNPMIRVALTNTVDVPVDMMLHISGEEINGSPVSGSQVDIDLSGDNCLAPAENGTPVTTIYYITRKGMTPPADENPDAVVRNVIVDDLNNLIKRIPDNVRFDMTARVNQNDEHMVDLSRDLNISGSYDVEVPLAFDALNINYTDTIANLQEDISDFLEQAKKMELVIRGKLYNGIPLPLQLNSRALNSEGEELNLEQVSLEVYVNGEQNGLISAPEQDGEAAPSEIEIRISAEGDELRQLDMIEWNVAASKEAQQNPETDGSMALKGSQYLLFKELQATLKQLTLDLN